MDFNRETRKRDSQPEFRKHVVMENRAARSGVEDCRGAKVSHSSCSQEKNRPRNSSIPYSSIANPPISAKKFENTMVQPNRKLNGSNFNHGSYNLSPGSESSRSRNDQGTDHRQPIVCSTQLSDAQLAPCSIKNADNRQMNTLQLSDWHNQQSGFQFSTNFVGNTDKPERNIPIKPWSFTEMNRLNWKDDESILYTILGEDPSFFALLEQITTDRKDMGSLLRLLGRAMTSHLHYNIVAMVNLVVRKDKYLFNKCSRFLSSIRNKFVWDLYSESTLRLSELLVKIINCVPHGTWAQQSSGFGLYELKENIRLLEKVCSTYLENDDQLCLLVSKNIYKLKIKVYNSLDCSSMKALQSCGEKELQLQSPDKDYRCIPVLPTIEEINSLNRSLEPNLVKGRYKDGEHYLDVQFRLCREDYLKPIRDGVAEYLSLKRQEKPLNSCKNVKVYSDVRIIKQEFVHGALVHLAHFRDKKFSKIRWEHSKRFLTGSLLCLSSDDFETMLFATIVHRQPKELRKGLVLLRFEEINEELLTLTRLRSFVVIETSAYFEAYRHNLQALQEIDGTELPMKSYIVEIQKNVPKPSYIKDSSIYDIRPLLLPLSRSSVEKLIKVEDREQICYKFNVLSDVLSQKAKNVSISPDECWPSDSELNLDPSQYAAVKAALTKRFVLIQGPPGTGKTYVGLRIVQLLLHNMHDTFAKGPILVVCYTNHALDQFLEGVLQFTNRIVRVGGRSTNTAISRCQLHHLRKAMEQRKEVPHCLYKLIQQKKCEIQQLIKCVRDVKQRVEMCYSTVLSENEMIDSLPERHKDFLKNKSLIERNDNVMHDWLCICVRHEDLCQNQANCKNDEAVFSNFYSNNSNPSNSQTAKDDEYDEECDETEIEFIETFRSISSQEFADFKIDEIFNEESAQIDGKVTDEKCKRFFTDHLARVTAMTEEETRKVDDLSLLSHIDRWRLYKFCLESFISKKQKEILEIQKRIQTKLAELNELQPEVDILPCLKAHVIGMTTTGAAKYRNIVKRLKPEIVVFEEAGEILESHIVTSLTSSTNHVILIGDHQQLMPSPSVHELAVQYNLNVSLFERMVQNEMPCYKLNVQHRMRPEIATLLVPHFYEDLKNHPLVTKYENMKGINKNVFFITHSYNELHEFDSKSKVNQHEATYLIKLCRYILLQGYKPSQITVLTMYSAQLLILKRLASDCIFKGVKFSVVDNYQGEERDIVLISFVRSNDEGEIGFLKVSNRVCVSLSRAKKALYCIGNFGMLKEKSLIWKNIVQILEKNQAIGSSLQLSCQNHLVCNSVSCEKDFDKVPEGGCSRICEFSLACGHTCQRVCHPFDKKHESVKCAKPCERKCNYGHFCKKLCFEECGPCTVLVERKMEPCGHIIDVKCFTRGFSEQKCTEACEKVLCCGHQCQNSCYSECTLKCLKKVDRVSPICGHAVEVECCNSNDFEHLAKICKEPCNQVLSCGHECQGTCSKCHQGRLHISCTRACSRILICGHKCTSSCSRICPPCPYPCENRCFHGKCTKKCSELCERCYKPCEWSCPHEKCDHPCFDKCPRNVCYERCDKLLKCNHPCIGLCGEPCPKVCRECDIAQFRRFDLEVKRNGKFVSLEDCGHIFELFDLMKWMESFVKDQREIRLAACPTCEVIIRRNSCFRNVVKSCLNDIEDAKRTAHGNCFTKIPSQCNLLDIMSLHRDKISDLFGPTNQILRILSGASSRIVTVSVENLFNLALSLKEGMNFFDNRPEMKKSKDSRVQTLYDELVQYMSLNKKLLINFMKDEILTLSVKQLQELSWEIHRLKLADKLLKFFHDSMSIEWSKDLFWVTRYIVSYKPFREKDTEKFEAHFQALITHYEEDCHHFFHVSYKRPCMENALSLTSGHWFVCSHKFVHFSAQPVYQCNECGSTIFASNIGLLTDEEVKNFAFNSILPELRNIEQSLKNLAKNEFFQKVK